MNVIIANKYKEMLIEKKEYKDPKAILKTIIDNQNEIQKMLKELEEIL